MPLITDLWYAHRARAGDKQAFDALFDRHAPRIYNLLRRLGASVSEAEDLCQETFIEAFHALPSWREASKLSTWLCGIAVNRHRSHRRAAGREPAEEPLDDSVPATFESDPFVRLSRSEATMALQTAIAELPEHCRESFVLVYVEQFSYKDTAQLLGVPVGTIQSRLNRAKQLLHVALSQTILPESNESPVKGGNIHVL